MKPETGAVALHKKAATRARILEAAAVLFAERGFERTSVARIAKRAGVSSSAVFWHFGAKATLFQETLQSMLAPFREAFDEDLSHLEPEKRLAETIESFDRFVSGHQETVQAIFRWLIEMPDLRDTLHRAVLDLHARFEADVREVLREIVPPGTDAGALSAGLLALLDGNLVLALIDPDRAAERRRAAARAMLSLLPRKPRSPGGR